MKKYKEKRVLKDVLVSMTCDRCGVETKSHMEQIEWLSWIARGGYNSIFGDGEDMTLDLCQKCLSEVLGPFIKFHGNAYFPEEDKEPYVHNVVRSIPVSQEAMTRTAAQEMADPTPFPRLK